MKKINRINEILLLLAPIVFYAFFAFYDGVIISIDSGSYIDMFESREPLYPLLIALFRVVFKEKEVYLFILVLFQSFLLGYVTYSLTKYLKHEFNLNVYASWLIEFILLGVSLLCRFASKKSLMYSNTILTESITYPLYLIFIKYIYNYLIYKDKKSLIISSTLVFLLISTRKQMYISLIILFFSIVIAGIQINNLKKGIIKSLLICIILFGSSKVVDYFYIYTNYNVVSSHTSDNRFITTMIYYVSDQNDSKYIEDKEAKELFEVIYDKSLKAGYTKECASGNWYERFTHFNENYDNIQVETMMPIMRDYISNNSDVDSSEVDILVDDVNSIIIKSLLIKKLPQIALVTIGNFFMGLVLTVSTNRQIFIYYAATMYLLYLLLTVSLYKKRGLCNCFVFSILVLISTILNVGVVSLVIFNQTRYTIYNMPLFYIAGLLMLYNLFIDKKKVNSNEENK